VPPCSCAGVDRSGRSLERMRCALAAAVLFLVLPLLLALLAQAALLFVRHLPRRRAAHSHQAGPGNGGGVRSLAACCRQRAGAEVLGQSEQLRQVLRIHALELVELRELAEAGKTLQEVHSGSTGTAAELAHHLLHGEEAIEKTADVLLLLARPARDAHDALVADHRGVLALRL